MHSSVVCHDRTGSMTFQTAIDNDGKGLKKRDFEEMENSNSSLGVYSSISNKPTKATFVEAVIRHELHQDLFCNTPDFLTKLFKADESAVEAIFTDAETKKICEHSRWAQFPQGKVAEAEVYEPFMAVLNFIIEGLPSSQVRWLSDHKRHVPNTNPDSINTADFKPDFISALNFPEVKTAGETAKVPWPHILVPGEVKKRNDEDAAALQLIKYMRQIFRECIDRRFVFGLTLAGSKMAVYLADRSGVIGSEHFDIHKASRLLFKAEPKKLIRVILAMATMEHHRLGWDPTLTVYDPDKPTEGTPLYLAERPVATSYKERIWLVEIQKPEAPGSFKMSQTEVESFLLCKPISLQRGDAILGRCTRIWKAILLSAMGKDASQQQYFIVKESWRDIRRPVEGDLYAQMGECDGIAKLHSYGIVRVADGDDTTENIRNKLTAFGRPRDINAKQNRAARMSYDSLLEGDILPDLLPEHPAPASGTDHLPLIRARSRLVLETFGWPIMFAKSLLEFVGHKNAVQKRVLHRDISSGNILITGNRERGKRGVLIDFDNAVNLDDYHPTLDDPLTGTRAFVLSEILTKTEMDIVEVIQLGASRPPAKRIIEHLPVHDLEAFFWVLVYFCISREGPARWRAELSQEPSADTDSLVSDFTSLFAAETDRTLAFVKSTMWKSKSMAQQSIISHVSPWTAPLIPLIADVYELLKDAYTARHFDDLHETIIELFNRTEIRLSNLPAEEDLDLFEDVVKLREAEEQRRRKDMPGQGDIQSPSKKAMVTASASTSRAALPQLPQPQGSPSRPSKRTKTDNSAILSHSRRNCYLYLCHLSYFVFAAQYSVLRCYNTCCDSPLAFS
ncbi:hypothetical protein HWV62_4994 [Athelia sp. TMB]|nr:hypothetical protein HWV62_4994 [Athelia sp. TMB]